MILLLRQILESLLLSCGASADWSVRGSQILLVGSILIGSLLLTALLQRLLIPLLLRLVAHTQNNWDDYLVNRPVLQATFQLLPSLLVYHLLPLCFDVHIGLTFTIIYRLTQAYIALSTTMLIGAFLKNLTTVTIEKLQEHHLVGIFQFLRLLTYCLGGIIIISLLFGYNPLRVIAGLGAAATVLLLVFKDTILGLVAGIQLSTNRMLKVGDWITLKRHQVDGIVEEVSLTTVKVRNFDNTISTIPPYTLISDSFQNWEAMFARGARRVRRSLYIDIRTIHFASDNLRLRLKRKHLITSVEAENIAITNLTLFRHYAVRTLHEDNGVTPEQWILARQLEPTTQGLPLEIWYYAKETSFVRFEELASTRMEQLIAILPEFEIRLFQLYQGPEENRQG